MNIKKATQYKLLFFLIVGVCFSIKIYCQNNISQEIKFASYLTKKKLYNEAIFVLKSQKEITINNIQQDSIFYNLGINYALIDSKELSNINFLKISTANKNLQNNAALNIGYNFMQLKNYDSAASYITKINENDVDSNIADLKNYFLSCNALLIRDTAKFAYFNNKINSQADFFKNSVTQNKFLYKKIINHKQKSAFLAGLFSTILPGAGKLYAGKTGEALGTLVPLATLGFLALEAYKNGGISTVPFWGFSTLFSIFYLGNIWGSALSVNIAQTQFNKSINNEININMQFPINSFLR